MKDKVLFYKQHFWMMEIGVLNKNTGDYQLLVA